MRPTRRSAAIAVAVLVTTIVVVAARSRRRAPPAEAIPAPSTITASSLRFLAVGRQGYGNRASRQIAEAMEHVAAIAPTHGVFYLGDNFYPRGVESVDDKQWQSKFEQLYDGPRLRGMPFFAVVGNHDHEGQPAAEVQYAREHRGSGRWQMDDLYYTRDFGRANGRVLLRIVFFDTILMQASPDSQLAFARRALEAPGDPVWQVLAGHYASRSVTKEAYTRERTLSALLPQIAELNADLYLSANDRFQQVLERPGEPLHVSANGGSDKQEMEVAVEQPGADFVATKAGFATVEVDPSRLIVTLYDIGGRALHTRTRVR